MLRDARSHYVSPFVADEGGLDALKQERLVLEVATDAEVCPAVPGLT